MYELSGLFFYFGHDDGREDGEEAGICREVDVEIPKTVEEHGNYKTEKTGVRVS